MSSLLEIRTTQHGRPSASGGYLVTVDISEGKFDANLHEFKYPAISVNPRNRGLTHVVSIGRLKAPIVNHCQNSGCERVVKLGEMWCSAPCKRMGEDIISELKAAQFDTP